MERNLPGIHHRSLQALDGVVNVYVATGGWILRIKGLGSHEVYSSGVCKHYKFRA